MSIYLFKNVGFSLSEQREILRKTLRTLRTVCPVRHVFLCNFDFSPRIFLINGYEGTDYCLIPDPLVIMMKVGRVNLDYSGSSNEYDEGRN